MRKAIYMLVILAVLVLLVFGIMGSLDTAVSYKYEVQDPIVEININKLPAPDQKIAQVALKNKQTSLERQELYFDALIIGSLLGFVLLLIYRKRFIGKTE